MGVMLEVEVAEPADQKARDALQGNLPALTRLLSVAAPLLLAGIEKQRAARIERLVDALNDGLEPTPLDITLAQLQAKAQRQVFESTEWLSSAQVTQLAGLGDRNPAATVNRWKAERRVFAIKHRERDLYPRYAFGADFKPLPGVRPILAALPWQHPDLVASWFASTSAFLDGKCPHQLLADDAKRVLAAAQDAAQNVMSPA